MKKVIQALLLIVFSHHYTSAQGYSYKPKYKKVLKKNKFKDGSGQHSRYYPAGISGYFNPPKATIKKLEKKFRKILQLKSESCCNANFKVKELEKFGIQYWRLIINNKKYIYTNAFKLSSENKIPKYFMDWKKRQVVVFNGSTAFWGALYSTYQFEFSQLAFNGPPFE